MKNSRIYSLDVFKLLMAYSIAFFHCKMEIAPGPTVSVQIFFMLSGFFLAKKFYSRSAVDPESYTAWEFSRDHLKALYPHFLFAWLVYWLYIRARDVLYMLKEHSLTALSGIVRDTYQELHTLMFTQSAYFERDGMMHQLWQLSAILIGGYFIYALLCRSEKTARRLILPSLVLMIESLLYTGVDGWSNYGPLYIPILRAVSAMSVGVFIYYFTTMPEYEKLIEHSLLLNLASVLSVAAIIAYGALDNLSFLTTAIVIWACLQPDSWINKALNHPCFRHCGKLSYVVYLNHIMIARIVMAQLMPRAAAWGISETGWQLKLLYFVMLTAWSAAALMTVEWLLAKKKKAEKV